MDPAEEYISDWDDYLQIVGGHVDDSSPETSSLFHASIKQLATSPSSVLETLSSVLTGQERDPSRVWPSYLAPFSFAMAFGPSVAVGETYSRSPDTLVGLGRSDIDRLDEDIAFLEYAHDSCVTSDSCSLCGSSSSSVPGVGLPIFSTVTRMYASLTRMPVPRPNIDPVFYPKRWLSSSLRDADGSVLPVVPHPSIIVQEANKLNANIAAEISRAAASAPRSSPPYAPPPPPPQPSLSEPLFDSHYPEIFDSNAIQLSSTAPARGHTPKGTADTPHGVAAAPPQPQVSSTHHSGACASAAAAVQLRADATGARRGAGCSACLIRCRHRSGCSWGGRMARTGEHSSSSLRSMDLNEPCSGDCGCEECCRSCCHDSCCDGTCSIGHCLREAARHPDTALLPFVLGYLDWQRVVQAQKVGGSGPDADWPAVGGETEVSSPFCEPGRSRVLNPETFVPVGKGAAGEAVDEDAGIIYNFEHPDFEYAAQCFGDACRSPLFLALPARALQAFVASDKTNCSEFVLFQACVRWARFRLRAHGLDCSDPRLVRLEMGPLVALIRWGRMTPFEFATIVGTPAPPTAGPGAPPGGPPGAPPGRVGPTAGAPQSDLDQRPCLLLPSEILMIWRTVTPGGPLAGHLRTLLSRKQDRYEVHPSGHVPLPPLVNGLREDITEHERDLLRAAAWGRMMRQAPPVEGDSSLLGLGLSGPVISSIINPKTAPLRLSSELGANQAKFARKIGFNLHKATQGNRGRHNQQPQEDSQSSSSEQSEDESVNDTQVFQQTMSKLVPIASTSLPIRDHEAKMVNDIVQRSLPTSVPEVNQLDRVGLFTHGTSISELRLPFQDRQQVLTLPDFVNGGDIVMHSEGVVDLRSARRLNFVKGNSSLSQNDSLATVKDPGALGGGGEVLTGTQRTDVFTGLAAPRALATPLSLTTHSAATAKAGVESAAFHDKHMSGKERVRRLIGIVLPPGESSLVQSSAEAKNVQVAGALHTRNAINNPSSVSSTYITTAALRASVASVQPISGSGEFAREAGGTSTIDACYDAEGLYPSLPTNLDVPVFAHASVAAGLGDIEEEVASTGASNSVSGEPVRVVLYTPAEVDHIPAPAPAHPLEVNGIPHADRPDTADWQPLERKILHETTHGHSQDTLFKYSSLVGFGSAPIGSLPAGTQAKVALLSARTASASAGGASLLEGQAAFSRWIGQREVVTLHSVQSMRSDRAGGLSLSKAAEKRWKADVTDSCCDINWWYTWCFGFGSVIMLGFILSAVFLFLSIGGSLSGPLTATFTWPCGLLALWCVFQIICSGCRKCLCPYQPGFQTMDTSLSWLRPRETTRRRLVDADTLYDECSGEIMQQPALVVFVSFGFLGALIFLLGAIFVRSFISNMNLFWFFGPVYFIGILNILSFWIKYTDTAGVDDNQVFTNRLGGQPQRVRVSRAPICGVFVITAQLVLFCVLLQLRLLGYGISDAALFYPFAVINGFGSVFVCLALLSKVENCSNRLLVIFVWVSFGYFLVFMGLWASKALYPDTDTWAPPLFVACIPLYILCLVMIVFLHATVCTRFMMCPRGCCECSRHKELIDGPPLRLQHRLVFDETQLRGLSVHHHAQWVWNKTLLAHVTQWHAPAPQMGVDMA